MSVAIPRPLLTLHVGQAGIQMGHAIWELFCLEHNIDPDGFTKRDCGDFGNVDAVFLTSPHGQHYPRSLFVDTDPCCVDELRSGPYRSLFSSRQLVSDQIDSGTNYATGRYGYVKRLLPETIDRLRWLTEKSELRPTLCLMHSSCGGTGSGFAVSLMTGAVEELGFTARSTLDFCVIPGLSAAQNSCELLNTALYLDECQALARQTFCITNSALFRVCASQLQSGGRATYAHVNRILAAAFSNLTATERLPGGTVSLSSMLDSLLPFEHLKYQAIGCAPFLTTELGSKDPLTAKSVASAVFEPTSQYLDFDPRTGVHAAGFLLYRGSVTLGEAQKATTEAAAKSRVRFHDWSPAGFRIGLTAPPPLMPANSGLASPAVSVTMLTSHSSLSGAFSRLSHFAKRLLNADLFVHNYEGALSVMLSRDVTSKMAVATSSAAPSDRYVDTSIDSESRNNDVLRQSIRRSINLSEWMTGARNSGIAQQQQQQQQQQQHQQQDASPSNSESLHDNHQRAGQSDVLGVRHRLDSAINYLDQVAKVYALDESQAGSGEASVDAATVQNTEELVLDLSPTEATVADKPRDSQTKVEANGIGTKIPDDNGGDSADNKNTVRWYEELPTDTAESSPAAKQPDTEGDPASSNPEPDQAGSSGYMTSSHSNSAARTSPSRRSSRFRSQLNLALKQAANQLSSLGSRLRGKRAKSAFAEIPASLQGAPRSPRLCTAARDDCELNSPQRLSRSAVIAEAHRVLEKYRGQELRED